MYINIHSKIMSAVRIIKPPLPSIQLTGGQINDITTYINSFRTNHQAQPLIWDVKIAKYAQNWANYLLLNNKMEHSGSSIYGENLAFFKNYNNDLITLIKRSIDLWYIEISNYDFTKNEYSNKTGHFTCLVWKDSSHFGIGISVDPITKRAVITFNTSPPGNIVGQFAANVSPSNETVVVKSFR